MRGRRIDRKARMSLPLGKPPLMPELMDEFGQLPSKQAKIVKIQKNPKIAKRNGSGSQHYENEIEAIEQQCAAKRSELALIEASDPYLLINEMKTECLELYKEIYRLKKLRREAHSQNMAISKQYAKAQFENIVCPFSTIDQENNTIIKNLELQKQKAEKLQKNIQNTNLNDIKALFNETITNLDSVIASEKQSIQQLKEKIAQIRGIQEARINDLTEYICN